MTTRRTVMMSGYLVELDPPYDGRVIDRYIVLVLREGMAEDDFWTRMRREFPLMPLKPIRRHVESGAIKPAPPKTPAADLVKGGWYWIRRNPGDSWTIAQVDEIGDDASFNETLKDWSTDYDQILAIGPRIPDHVPDDTDDPCADGRQDACPCKEPAGGRTGPVRKQETRNVDGHDIRTVATIHQAEGVRIDDMAALNANLMAGETGLKALYATQAATLPGWEGPFMIDGNDEILIADSEARSTASYGSTTEVGRYWTKDVTETIAAHLTAGTLTIEIMEMGQLGGYLVITPGAFDVRDDV